MRLVLISFLLGLLFFSSYPTFAKVDVSKYGLIFNKEDITIGAKKRFDSTFKVSAQFNQTKVEYYISRPHKNVNHTSEFYLLLCLCAILGAIKTLHPKYFNDVWRAFINPTLASSQLKGIIQAASFPNLLMNLFSTIVIGAYVFYLISINVDWRFVGIPSGIIVSLLILGSTIMYLTKYAFIQFTGWAFNLKNITDQYNFNIFLVNKVLGMVLLPFVVCFAFLDDKWDNPICIISEILLVGLILNRYLRSWNIFAQFFMNSRFHFFMYLCGFEILPLAVLLKLVLRIL